MKGNIITILIIISAAIFCSGCTEEEETLNFTCITPEQTKPVQTQTPVETTGLTPDETGTPETGPSAKWKADGIINEDEYDNNVTGFRDLFYIYWSSDKEMLYMGMKGKTTGWLSVGFNPTLRMKDADIIMGGIKGSDPYIYDMYSIGTYGPHPSDTKIGGTYDIELYMAAENEAYTTVEFSRKLDTGDNYDSVLAKGDTAKILWSLSRSDSVDNKHDAGKGTVEIII